MATSEIWRVMLGRHIIVMAYALARPNDLAYLFESRMNELPPKEVDLIATRITNDFLECVGNHEAMTAPQLTRWSGVAPSQSAIYRLLAPGSFGAITVEPDRLLRVLWSL